MKIINIPPEKRKHLDHKLVMREWLKNPGNRQAYDDAQTEFAPIEAILEARMKKGMTQAQIAKKMGTTQSSIARVEAGKSHPTIPFLQRLADATGTRLSIRFLPQ